MVPEDRYFTLIEAEVPLINGNSHSLVNTIKLVKLVPRPLPQNKLSMCVRGGEGLDARPGFSWMLHRNLCVHFLAFDLAAGV